MNNITALKLSTPQKDEPKPLKFKVGNKRAWIPAEIYNAEVVSIEQKMLFKDKPILEFIFEIASGEHEKTELRGFCNANYQTFSENTKLYQWCAAATGNTFEPGEELDLGVFYNKVLIVKVEEKISRKTKNKFSNVTEILGIFYEP